MNLIKPLTVIFGTLISYILLISIDKKKNIKRASEGASERANERASKRASEMKDIFSKTSLFLALFVIFIALVYLFNITSLFKFNKIFGRHTHRGGDLVDSDTTKLDDLEQQNLAELETVRKVRENINVGAGVSLDSFSIGQISRK